MNPMAYPSDNINNNSKNQKIRQLKIEFVKIPSAEVFIRTKRIYQIFYQALKRDYNSS